MGNRRRRRARRQDIEVTESYGSGVYRVNGNRGINYEVDITEPSCTCPDWFKREPTGGCKHIIAARMQTNGSSSPGTETSDPVSSRSESIPKVVRGQPKQNTKETSSSETADLPSEQSSQKSQGGKNLSKDRDSKTLNENSSTTEDEGRNGNRGLFIGLGLPITLWMLGAVLPGPAHVLTNLGTLVFAIYIGILGLAALSN